MMRRCSVHDPIVRSDHSEPAWPWLLIILVAGARACAGASCSPARLRRHADAHQDAAAGGSGTRPRRRSRPRRTTPDPGDCHQPPRRSHGRTRRPPPRSTRRPLPTAAQPQRPTRHRPPAAAHAGRQAGDPMASPDFGVQAFLWWRPEVADRDLQSGQGCRLRLGQAVLRLARHRGRRQGAVRLGPTRTGSSMRRTSTG